jgi:hypothetical protein
MRKRRAPKPVRLGGQKADDSLVFVALRGIADNLGNILRVALVLGFVAILDPLLAKIDGYVSNDSRRAPTVVEMTTEQKLSQPESGEIPSAGALRAIRESEERLQFVSNCTRVEFQKTHYDDCFPNGSTVYPRPTADEDDGSLLFLLERDTLYANR